MRKKIRQVSHPAYLDLCGYNSRFSFLSCWRQNAAHNLFEYGPDGAYTLVLPPWTGGVLSLRGRATKVADLWRKQARRGAKDGPLRLRLDPTAKGKLVFGETALLFQFAPPAPPVRKDPFPQEYRARVFAGFTRFDMATLLSGLLILGPYFIWAASKPIDPTIEPEIDERFLRVMGVPPKKEKEPEPEEKDDEEKLLAVEDDEKKKEKDPEIVDKMISPSKSFSKEAIAKARGVGVARVLGTYGPVILASTVDDAGSTVIPSLASFAPGAQAQGYPRVTGSGENLIAAFLPELADDDTPAYVRSELALELAQLSPRPWAFEPSDWVSRQRGEIDAMRMPSEASARTLLSRPGPGPLIRTSRFLMPCS